MIKKNEKEEQNRIRMNILRVLKRYKRERNKKRERNRKVCREMERDVEILLSERFDLLGDMILDEYIRLRLEYPYSD